jgi:hypothetical protein
MLLSMPSSSSKASMCSPSYDVRGEGSGSCGGGGTPWWSLAYQLDRQRGMVVARCSTF